MSTTYDLVKTAILEKKQIHANYKEYWREMCPHIIETKGGKPYALFYQFGGSSSSGLRGDGNDWRCIKLDLLKDVEIIDDKWHTGNVKGTGNQTCVDDIDVEVEL